VVSAEQLSREEIVAFPNGQPGGKELVERAAGRPR
jgi:hypothetical protein